MSPSAANKDFPFVTRLDCVGGRPVMPWRTAGDFRLFIPSFIPDSATKR